MFEKFRRKLVLELAKLAANKIHEGTHKSICEGLRILKLLVRIMDSTERAIMLKAMTEVIENE